MEAIFNGCEEKSGVYRIYNKLNNRTYYGSAKKFGKRYKDHFKILKKHTNKYLQNDFIKTGSEHFAFEILEVTSLKERFTKEQEYIDKFYDFQNQCYNFKKQVIQNERSVFSNTPTTTSKILSTNALRQWADPVIREKILINGAAAMNTLEYKENIKRAHKASWVDNTVRKENASKKFTKMWEDDREKVYERMHSEDAIIKKLDVIRKLKINEHKQNYLNKTTEIDWLFEPDITKYQNKNRNRHKTYFNANLLSPAGVLYKNITNLENFSKYHKLSGNKVSDLIYLKILNYKGWIKYFNLEENYNLFLFQKGYKNKRDNIILSEHDVMKLQKIIGSQEYTVISPVSFFSPDNIIHNNIENITQFALLHDLSRKCLELLKIGKIKTHKGWTLYKPN